jgi:hypothetical protein
MRSTPMRISVDDKFELNPTLTQEFIKVRSSRAVDVLLFYSSPLFMWRLMLAMQEMSCFGVLITPEQRNT